MNEREEWFEQTQGAGILELRGGSLELALFVQGKPLIYDAADCEGSVCRFTALLPESPSPISFIDARTILRDIPNAADAYLDYKSKEWNKRFFLRL